MMTTKLFTHTAARTCLALIIASAFNPTSYAQEPAAKWKPADSIVQIFYKDKTNQERVVNGVVYAHHQGQAFVFVEKNMMTIGGGIPAIHNVGNWRPLNLGRSKPPALSNLAKKLKDEYTIILKPGQLESSMLPAKLVADDAATGYRGYVFSADANKMPPPIQFGDRNELTEGDQVSLLSVSADRGRQKESDWIFTQSDKIGTVTELDAKTDPPRVQINFKFTRVSPHFVFDKHGKFLGGLGETFDVRRRTSQAPSWLAAQFDATRDLKQFAVAEQNFVRLGQKGNAAKLMFYLRTTTITEGPENVSVQFEVKPAFFSFEFDQELRQHVFQFSDVAKKVNLKLATKEEIKKLELAIKKAKKTRGPRVIGQSNDGSSRTLLFGEQIGSKQKANPRSQVWIGSAEVAIPELNRGADPKLVYRFDLRGQQDDSLDKKRWVIQQLPKADQPRATNLPRQRN